MSETKKTVVTIKSIFEGYAEKSKKEKETKFIIDAKKRVKIQFISDFNEFVKGEIIEVGIVASDFYIANQVAKEYK